jgi:hypothetical protein
MANYVDEFRVLFRPFRAADAISWLDTQGVALG